MTTAYRCPECKWLGLGSELDQHTVRGDPASGEAYWVIEETCPECGHDEPYEVELCVDCLDYGIEVEATHDERCRPHFVEHADCEAEHAADCRRDLIEPVQPLVRQP